MAANDLAWRFESKEELAVQDVTEQRRVKTIREEYRIIIVDQILDNVHWFIGLTEVERKLIDLPVFSRLQSIKQLSLVNWVFPGAEHTRYTHSLGEYDVTKTEQEVANADILGLREVNVLVTGAAGQLGSDVVAELSRRGINNTGIDIAELDITDTVAVCLYLREHKPSCIIHCAAYTAVDKAEDEPELCMRINAEGTENLARACHDINAEMIYISTDYVFGDEGDTPYETDARKFPLSVYGKSKLAGEDAVIRHLDRYYIVRTSWVFGANGSNFVKTMLRLSKERDEINVVNDQIGSPTYTPDLAVLLCDMAQSGKYGVYHATNEGYCSWAEFAAEIMRLSGSSCRINPIPTDQYPTKAIRPKNSRMSKTSLDMAGFARLPDWKDALRRYLID